MHRQISPLTKFDFLLEFKWLLYLAMGLGTLLIPPVLSRWNPPILYSAEYYNAPPFDLFVFLATGVLLVVGFFELRGRMGESLRQLAPTIVPLFLALHFLIIFKQYSAKSWDYRCFESGAMAVVKGAELYGDCYLYWPLLAQGMAWLHNGIEWGVIVALDRPADDPMMIWNLIFYFYQCAQYLMILLAYFLLYRFATRLAIDRALASLLIAALFVLSNSFYANLNFNQLGLVLLNLCLLSILLLESHPVVSGLLVAFGGHVKLYPFILMLPWTLKLRWKAIGGIIGGSLVILLVQTYGGRDWALWRQYIDKAKTLPVGTLFRDNSVQNIVQNSLRQLGYIFNFDVAPYTGAANILAVSFSLAALGWYLLRFRAREKAAKQAAVTDVLTGAQAHYEHIAMYGHSAEALAFALIISPLVWEHHYVLTLPLAIWAIAVIGRQRPWLFALLLALTIGLPTFNVYPFSYHRIAGLILLLIFTPPSFLPVQSAPAGEGGLHHAPDRRSLSSGRQGGDLGEW